MKKIYVQYGCGMVAPVGWINFDASPTLRIQKVPLLGKLARPFLNCVFPDAVRYGDIVRGLPIPDNSADGVFCSHVLEHLSLEDFYVALNNTYKILKPGGLFRCIIPDMETHARGYIDSISFPKPNNESSVDTASIRFLRKTSLGIQKRRKSIKGLATLLFGNAVHRWMWDKYSFSKALSDQGFVYVEPFVPNLCEDEMFILPEEEGQFHNAIALQCRKPFKEVERTTIQTSES